MPLKPINPRPIDLEPIPRPRPLPLPPVGISLKPFPDKQEYQYMTGGYEYNGETGLPLQEEDFV
jgi:hypothetical protein